MDGVPPSWVKLRDALHWHGCSTGPLRVIRISPVESVQVMESIEACFRLHLSPANSKPLALGKAVGGHCYMMYSNLLLLPVRCGCPDNMLYATSHAHTCRQCPSSPTERRSRLPLDRAAPSRTADASLRDGYACTACTPTSHNPGNATKDETP